MGVPAQLAASPRRPDGAAERGAALILVIITLTVLGILVAGSSMMASSVIKGTSQRSQTSRAFQVTEAGVAHALGLLRGPLGTRSNPSLLRGADGVAGTADDGVLSGYAGLTSGQAIPLAGVTAYGGTYKVQLLDDPADGDANPTSDLNFRIMIRCTGTLADGSTASTDVIVASASLPAIVVDGSLEITGNPAATGECGSVHANGTLTATGVPSVSGTATASGSIVGAEKITAPGGIKANQPELEVPNFAYGDFCPAGANWRFELVSGAPKLIESATGTAHDPGALGWTYAGGMWTVSGSDIQTEGKVCVTGDVGISGSPGSLAAPERVSIYATGSIDVSGSPTLSPKIGDPFVLFALGDVRLMGNTNSAFNGAVFAGAQCQIGGNPGLNGQIVCKDNPQPVGARELFSVNRIYGNPGIAFNCGGLGGAAPRPIAWMPRYFN